MLNKFARTPLSIAILLAAPIAAPEAFAVLEEVKVTAQKREESLQDTPIAMSASNAADIVAKALITARDIFVDSPNVQSPAYPFSSNNLALFIRGIGNADSIVLTKDNTVGLYFDGVYAARTTGLLSDLIALERVEILRGPQGTLYGRNTTAGAVNFISAKPTGELGADVSVSAGDYNYLRGTGHLDLPDMGGFKAKLSAAFSERDGWVENEGPNEVPGYKYNDYYEQESDGYRLALRFDGIDNLLVDYSYDYSEVDYTTPYFQYSGAAGGLSVAFMPITNSFTDRLENTRSPVGGAKTAYYLPASQTEVEGHNLTVTYDINDNMTLKSITGIREFEDDVSQNFSESFGGAGSLSTHTITDHEQFSQEIQLIGTHDRITYVGGLYYFEEEGTQAEQQFVDRALAEEVGIQVLDLITNMPCGTGLGALPACTDFTAIFPAFLGEYTAETDIESWAAFGQVTYTVIDDLDLTLGLRYTDDDREAVRTNDGFFINAFPPGVSASQDEQLDYTLVADYNINDDMSSYFKIATGFRSGGSSRNGSDFNKSFGKEELISYELGFKSEFSDRVRLNTAVFFMQIDDIILDYLPDPVNSPSNVEVFNSGEADVWGLEIDLQAAITDNFLVGLGYAYLDYDFEDTIFPDGSDNTDTTELVWAPEHALSLSTDYHVPMDCGELRFHFDYAWQDDQFALANTDSGEVVVGDYGLLNGRISMAEVEMAGGSWEFAIWGRNLTDEDSANYKIGATAQTFLAPRMYGGEVRFSF
ncbi:MAG: TonB-dependent receptor [Halioglobus sp.]|nr:TonB-dependent receptor [Halioglobus sp.]